MRRPRNAGDVAASGADRGVERGLDASGKWAGVGVILPYGGACSYGPRGDCAAAVAGVEARLTSSGVGGDNAPVVGDV